MLLRKWRALSLGLALIAATTLGAVGAGCAQTDVRLGDETPDAAPTSSTFTPPPGSDASGEADAPIVKVLMCIGTECPAPYATCNPENGPTFKCGVDLAHDPDNYGACGNKCLVYDPLALSSRCVEGKCELECLNKPGAKTLYKNCNGSVDDGCEVDVSSDAKNCGACGITCDVGAGQPCVEGKCLMQECDAGVTR